MFHHFTVDVEEYFQTTAFEARVPRDRWGDVPPRLDGSLDSMLDLLERHGVRGTFFTLGWLGRHRPHLVREIVARGHEIASHGWDHHRVWTVTPEAFRKDVRDTRRCLEDVSGKPVLGYRAACFSIIPGCEWALELLLEEGHGYDSSLFPIRRPGARYGYPGAERYPHWIELSAGRLLEFPPATLRVMGVTVPVGGGASFRHAPYVMARRAFAEAERCGASATFYTHPWETDVGQPRTPLPLLSRFRRYGGMRGLMGKMDHLLRDFRFRPLVDTFREMEAGAAADASSPGGRGEHGGPTGTGGSGTRARHAAAPGG